MRTWGETSLSEYEERTNTFDRAADCPWLRTHCTPGGGGVCYTHEVHKPTPDLVLSCDPTIPPREQEALCHDLERMLGEAPQAAAAPEPCDFVRLTLADAHTPAGAAQVRQAWDRSVPVVVSGLMLGSNFTLDALIAKQIKSDESVMFVVADDRRIEIGDYRGEFQTLLWSEFRGRYHSKKKRSRNTPGLRVKDLPEDASFEETYPAQFDELRRRMAPVPYLGGFLFDAVLNVAPYLPLPQFQPDLGPKTYIGEDETFTRVHLDMSDAFNLMVECSGNVGCVGAVWHMWRVEDQQKVRASFDGRHMAHGG
jgi:hypothetical protein